MIYKVLHCIMHNMIWVLHIQYQFHALYSTAQLQTVIALPYVRHITYDIIYILDYLLYATVYNNDKIHSGRPSTINSK